MSLTPTIFDHPSPNVIQGFAVTAGGFALIGLGFIWGNERLGASDTSQYAWRIAALLFLIPLTADAILRLMSSPTYKAVFAEWAPRFELFFIVIFSGSLAMAFGPSVIAGEQIPSLTLASSIAGYGFLLLFLVSSPKFLPGVWLWRSKAYVLSCAALWSLFFFSFLDRYVGPHPPDAFLPTALLLLVAGVLVRFAAAFRERHPMLFD